MKDRGLLPQRQFVATSLRASHYGFVPLIPLLAAFRVSSSTYK